LLFGFNAQCLQRFSVVFDGLQHDGVREILVWVSHRITAFTASISADCVLSLRRSGVQNPPVDGVLQ
jgi:hypothetical protein